MDILVIASDYPHGTDAGGAFVQARVDLYRGLGHRVCVWSRKHSESLDFDPDVVQAHYPLPDFVIPKASAFVGKAPIVAYLHGAEAIRVPGKPFLWGVKARRAVRRFLRTTAACITESVWMSERIDEYLGVRPRVIPNPVDEQLFRACDAPLSKRGLCLRGQGWKYGTDLLDGNVDVDVLAPLWSRRELPRILNKYAFFVAPSRVEGQGLMACEALATGMPVVSTRVGGIPEFVKDEFSILTQPDPASIREAIEKIPRHLTPGQRGGIRESILRICGSSVMIPKDLQIMRDVVEKIA